jgi:hypothetical protein
MRALPISSIRSTIYFQSALTRPLPKPIAMLLVAVVILRVATVTWSATGRALGDFYASLPGAHVETLNPTLWSSPDLGGAWGYHNPTYFHGPTQYLTLYPLGLLDSWAQIAAVLLPIYAAVLALTFWMLWRIALRLGADRDVLVPLLASTFLFFPLLQAYLQREFEVVLTALLAGALLLLVNGRQTAAAVVLAYAAWFKYIPLMFVGYLGLRRWWRPVAAYVVASAVILLVSQLLFGLPRFFNNNVPGHARQVFALWGFAFDRDATGHLYGMGFCEGWRELDSTFTNVRHGLCTMAASHSWINPPLIYLAICFTVAIVYLLTHARLERTILPAAMETRRRAIEFSIVTTICSCFFFAHYYYLIALIIPFNVLLAIYWTDRRVTSLGLWLTAYTLVGAFVIPLGVVYRLTGRNIWELYVWQGWFWYGEMLLVGLLLAEYARLARRMA